MRYLVVRQLEHLSDLGVLGQELDDPPLLHEFAVIGVHLMEDPVDDCFLIFGLAVFKRESGFVLFSGPGGRPPCFFSPARSSGRFGLGSARLVVRNGLQLLLCKPGRVHPLHLLNLDTIVLLYPLRVGRSALVTVKFLLVPLILQFVLLEVLASSP